MRDRREHKTLVNAKPYMPDTSNLTTIVGRRDEDPHYPAYGPAPCGTDVWRGHPDSIPRYPAGEPIPVQSVGEIYELQKQENKKMQATTLPTDSDERKNIPIATGVLDYFPAAIAEVAKLSKVGNDKHNPGEDLHWARGKSMDHADTIARHLLERGTFDTDGERHSTKVAWRALAMLQEELEAAGAPMSRGSRPEPPMYFIDSATGEVSKL